MYYTYSHLTHYVQENWLSHYANAFLYVLCYLYQIYMICFICTSPTPSSLYLRTGCLIMLMPPYMTLAPAHPLWLTTMDPWGQTFVFVTKSCHRHHRHHHCHCHHHCHRHRHHHCQCRHHHHKDRHCHPNGIGKFIS